jgi:uncharacterized membrane protein YhaH (DUF805 family)
MESVFFLVDVVTVAVAGVVALTVVRRSGGRRAVGALATGIYWLAIAILLAVVPVAAWPRARTDNAFLGLYPIAIVALVVGVVAAWAGVRRLRRSVGSPGLAPAALVAAVGLVLASAVLLARGPDAWQTGSGQFGLDVVGLAVVIAAGVFAIAERWLQPANRQGESESHVHR